MHTSEAIAALGLRIKEANIDIQKIRHSLSTVLIGQNNMIDKLLIGLLTGGHILLEGVPGLAKTLSIKSLAQSVQASFKRIQFTPDLLPADVVGTLMYNQATHSFTVRKGPIFGNFILADEINRAPAKVQSALLEAMQEKQVTIGDNTYTLDEPFLVLATQNPLDQEGTYPLPEAQLDRFMLKVYVTYPTVDEEVAIVTQQLANNYTNIAPVVSIETINSCKQLVDKVYISDAVKRYIVNIIFCTRFPLENGLKNIADYITYGASPRGSISLALAAKAYAFLQGRAFVIPEDVQTIAYDVLRHRIGISYEAEVANVSVNNIIATIIQSVKVP